MIQQIVQKVFHCLFPLDQESENEVLLKHSHIHSLLLSVAAVYKEAEQSGCAEAIPPPKPHILIWPFKENIANPLF